MSARVRQPHPATVIVRRPPHAATVQPKEIPSATPKAPPPHPAMLPSVRPPHAAVPLIAGPSRSKAVMQRMFDDDLILTDDVEESSSYEPDYNEFWSKLQKLDDEKSIITDIGLEVKLVTTKKQGILLAAAKPLSKTTYSLQITTETSEKKPIYWLPWIARTAVAAKRRDFESEESGCDYFFTTQLDGCTFTITDEEVMHIAADFPGGFSKAEKDQNVLKHFTPKMYQNGDTKRRGFVFGVRKKNGWVYYFGQGHFVTNCEKIERWP